MHRQTIKQHNNEILHQIRGEKPQESNSEKILVTRKEQKQLHGHLLREREEDDTSTDNKKLEIIQIMILRLDPKRVVIPHPSVLTNFQFLPFHGQF